MMKGFLMTRRNMLFSLVGMLMTAMLTIWGCGGGGSSYSDPVTTTKTSSAFISAATLKQWIDEGKLNAPVGSADRVVVVSTSSLANWTDAVKGHISGAVRLDPAEIAITRVEGLGAVSKMVPDGASMDVLVKRLGIDANTTIVLTIPKNGTITDQSVTYFDFRYWGFPRERIKILNGGDDAWDVAGYALSTDATEKYAASTYSVSQNAALKDVVRYSLSEIFAKVDELIATPALLDTWQLIDVRGFTTKPYITNAIRLSGYTMYLTRLDANNDGTPDADRNYIYPDKATFEAKLADGTVYPVRNSTSVLADVEGTDGAHISPTKKTVVMCGTSTTASPNFVLFDAVLALPEGDIAMYDGSSTQWNNYSRARLLLGYPDLPESLLSAWSFDNTVNPRSLGAAMATTAVTWSVLWPTVGPTDPLMNQIEEADRAYIQPAATTTTGGSGGTGGASEEGGC
jgi:3-mercaptopyruvate sulfurtransferase SseA